jgi:hypothetical protein
MAVFVAIGTILAGFIVGGLLLAIGHVFLGIIVAAVALPLALVVWIKAGEDM